MVIEAFEEELSRIDAICETLAADSARSAEPLDALPPPPQTPKNFASGQSTARQFVRSFFAEVDGVSHAMIAASLRLHDLALTKLSVAQLEATKRVKKRKMPLRDRVPLAFDVLTSAFGVPFHPRLDDPRWHCFEEAVKLRNRLTHPKSVEHLSPEDVGNFIEGGTWFEEQVLQVIAACSHGLNSMRRGA